MYKKTTKLILFIIVFILTIGINTELLAKCNYDSSLSIGDAIGDCLDDSAVVKPGSSVELTGTGFKDVLLGWIKSLSIFLSAGAVFAIVYGSLLLTLSGGEDDKIKKGKDIIKWSLIGFLGVIFAGAIISIIINFVYSLS
ncbi:hypothetical protein CSB08_00565 [Candidatus Gracilibacteria bacterium]|nr:MAG: hypothetical protein CSB08_00565 [Candidatus Gracilibacteria bacterium]PIE85333.1 MAG: hypothetical protein CSA08_02920 [Candidatus Gracilibacteria bacterium]